MEHEDYGDTNSNRNTWNNPQRTGKISRKFRNQRTRRDHLDFIFKIDQKTEKSSGDLGKLTDTETPVKGH